jgi:hypothetical protein
MNKAIWSALPVLALAAACGGSSAPTGSSGVTATSTETTSAAASTSAASSGSASGSCSTSSLSLRVTPQGAAAGSNYDAIVFTNTSSAPCTLYGYPGVSFATSADGQQVGSAAGRNTQHPSVTVTLDPGSSASALLQIANTANFPPSDCKATPVGGLRVYPPGEKKAGYVAFDQPMNVCSSAVHQLSVEAVVSGSTGSA